MGCGDTGRTRGALDEKEVAAYIRHRGVAAGIGHLVGDGDIVDTDTAAVRQEVAGPVVHRRTERHRGTVGGETDAPTGQVRIRFAVDIQTALVPLTRSGVPVIYANVASVTTGRIYVVVGRTHRDSIAVGGQTDAESALVAAGDDFVGGGGGPGETVVAGEPKKRT